MSEKSYFMIQTEYGPVKGVRKESVLGREFFSFSRIPYMKAPVGKLRFRDPQAPEKWTEPVDATLDTPSFVAKNYYLNQYTGQEDAAFVNVYTPILAGDDPLPVLVWIHGGAFICGSGNTDEYGPDYFMQKNVILVTMNYRLGVIGFLSLDDKELGIPGNAGLKDQAFALKWVQQNIKAFGGDPNKVTLFGESAGSASVHHHMISEHSKGLFQRSILMSASAFTSCFALVPKRDHVKRLAKALGWDGTGGEKAILELLESTDALTLVKLSETLLTDDEAYGESFLIPFGPVIEPYKSANCFIPIDTVNGARTAWSNGIDSLCSVTSFEGIFFNVFGPDIVPKSAVVLQNPDFFIPLPQMSVSISKDKISECGKKIKEIYYGKLNPSATNDEAYFHFMSDRMFLHDVHRMILSRVNSKGSGKTFFFRFGYDTKLNYVKKLANVEKFPGATHADDLAYIFHAHLKHELITSPTINDDFDKVRTMINIFVNFATYGSTQVGDVTWPAVTSKLPMNCLDISNDKIEVIPFKESGRMKVWDEVYNDVKSPLF